MKRSIITTADGSKTIKIEDWNEHYHSKHGAIAEAYHVFIHHGLHYFKEAKELSILEMGFGTGLNAFITFLESVKNNLQITYTGIEAYPVSTEEASLLEYAKALQADKYKHVFEKLHHVSWETQHQISSSFYLQKHKRLFSDVSYNQEFTIIYFDAFGARVQPELWTEEIFKTMYQALKPNGVLVTYSAKGSVKRAMQAVGFTVEKLPGPPGKREMLRAIKKV